MIQQCQNPMVIDLVSGLLETTSNARLGSSPQILDLQNMEIIPANQLPQPPTCDGVLDVQFLFRDGYSCSTNSMLGDGNILLSDLAAIEDNTEIALSFSVGGVQLVSPDPNIVVDDINVPTIRIVDASLLTSPIAINVRIPNSHCVPISVDAEITSVTPLVSGYAIGENLGDTLNYP